MNYINNLPDHLAPLPYNMIADSDSYKLGHYLGYRENTTITYSYIESRGGRYPEVMLAGLQRLLYAKLGQPITRDQVEEMASFARVHMGSPNAFNRVGWEIILNEYGGRLPLLIKSVPEGLMIPVRNILVSVENLDPRLPWLTSYFETMILRDVWTACTIAARIFYMTRRIKAHWEIGSDNPMSPFALLDFSSRGTMGYDHSVLGGIGYLFHFMGSDNVPAVREANYYYHEPMSGFSVAASEHSISSSFGRDNDADYIDHCLANMVDPGGILSLVGDTWDIFKFIQVLSSRKETIANKGVKIVARPDSGALEDVLPRVIGLMAEGFGVTRNAKGRDVINLEAKVLQGDGMNETTHLLPFTIAEDLRVAPDSIITAAGGGLMTCDLDRDTNRWAMKASEMVIDGKKVPIFKDPVTDPGKTSKMGRQSLIKVDGEFRTARGDGAPDLDWLNVVYDSGRVMNPETLATIRERVALQL